MEAKDTVMSINAWLDRHGIDRAYKADMKTTYEHFRGELEGQAEISFEAGYKQGYVEGCKERGLVGTE